MAVHKKLEPNYAKQHEWEVYGKQLMIEYEQSLDEGLDLEEYRDLFESVAKMPDGASKEKIADVLFELVQNAHLRGDYRYQEPSELDAIRQLRKPYVFARKEIGNLEEKIHGAWLGRICGCLLGKTVEGIRTDELHPLLKETGNFPMYRYIRRAEITEEMLAKYRYGLRGRCYADKVEFMPFDDDTNYMVLSQELVEKYGRDFTSYDVSRTWLALQPKDAYCTAERVAFCNFVKGYEPPESAMYKNPYREWIGAQIRGDYFGYINPGDPEMAAEMAFRDASISHVKNGIYGEMWAAAMIACAAVTDNIEDIILGGLAEIPATSRLYEDLMKVLHAFHSGVTQADCFRMIHEQYDEYSAHGWCHTNSNAMIVAASLLYGEGNYGKSICMAVETGFDTDCNGATVGSVLGMRSGVSGIPEEWSVPIHDTLQTTIFGIDKVKISECAKKTLNHIK